ncbi:MAG: DNA mismatch repair protein MutS [Eubacterium sp.]|nr:DNA mismatch repair protein MutS [Eubacterium sp.]
MAEFTPMMKQYLATKEEYKDCILFYRLGDFYEMFFEDAKIVSKELELTLTGKSCGMEERAPMCGVPFHAAETYLNRLVEKGYKVAICEQVEDPKKAKGIVKREVIRVVTPGTNLNGGALDDSKNNYIICLYEEKDSYGLCVSDVSTGYFALTQLTSFKKTIDEVNKYSPSEIIVSELILTHESEIKDLRERLGIVVTEGQKRYFNKTEARDALIRHFKVASLKGLGLEDYYTGMIAAGALMNYLTDTQKNDLKHITAVLPYETGSFMFLDSSTRRNLELTETMREKRKIGSLLWVLDKTKTAMGSRLLRSYIEQPLISSEEIKKRLGGVETFFNDVIGREELREYLNPVYDLERLIGRIAYQNANPRDLIAFKTSLEYLPAIKKLLKNYDDELIQEIEGDLDPLSDICTLIDESITDEPPITLRDGGIIKEGFSETIDDYRSASVDGKKWLAKIAEDEKEKTGIKNLRINYNKVFGYYLEVTNSYLSMVPDYFIRKQTLTNAERFITDELKSIEDKILGAEEKLTGLEYDTFCMIRDSIAAEVIRIQKTAKAIAKLDVILSLAHVAEKNRYCKPEITDEDMIDIKAGRHPVVELTLDKELFVENDTVFNSSEERILLITGPNMAGKSTYMRQTALIVLMAQIGSFVPAAEATIGVCDRIFTRVGASDDLSSGQSTFMLEMNEVSNILRNATAKSLIILDEIGRGTSTYDGLSIAWAVVEYISKTEKLCAKTLFATHYHELISLEDKLPNVKNYNIAVKESGDTVVFLRKIIRGGADRSYGIEVARLAGVPSPVLKRAKEVLLAIVSEKDSEITDNIKSAEFSAEENTDIAPKTSSSPEISVNDFAVLDRLKNLKLEKVTPIEAINILYELQTPLLENED